MQAVVNRTRHQQSVSACINFARAIPIICETVTSSAPYLSLSDRLQSFSTASNSSKAASSCCTLRGSSSNPFITADRTFASTAEFSGGSFNVSSSSSSSESDDNRQSSHNADTDTKEMLLESSLGHVVILNDCLPTGVCLLVLLLYNTVPAIASLPRCAIALSAQ